MNGGSDNLSLPACQPFGIGLDKGADHALIRHPTRLRLALKKSTLG